MFKPKVALAKGSKKLINAWAFYDWANSVYPLVISSAIFPIYYGMVFADNNQIDFFGYSVKNTAMISFVTATAFVVVALISPILSGIADYIGNKKKFMKFFVFMGSLSCVGLFWFDLSTIYLGFLFYFLAMIGLWSSLVFYNSYLPDIAFEDQQDRASAKGYSLGYIGSVLLLIFNLSMIMKPQWYGIEGTESESAMLAMKYSFVSVGVWWAFFQSFFILLSAKRKQRSKDYSGHSLEWLQRVEVGLASINQESPFKTLFKSLFCLQYITSNGYAGCCLFWGRRN